MKCIAPLLLGFVFFGASSGFSQKLKKADKLVISQLEAHISYLADDKLEGRRAGTAGESLAKTYISKQFEAIGLQPLGDDGWFQTFPIFEGRDYRKSSYLFINGNEIGREHFFPLTQSPENIVEGMPSMALKEEGVPWFLDLAAEKEAHADNPHFDVADNILEKVKDAAAKGATALILYNDPEFRYNPKQRGATLPIPVFFIDSVTAAKYLSDETEALEIKCKAGFTEIRRSGTNVVGFIDNGAPYTIILGAHYDHLGYGEDGNSMLRSNTRQIHNGADDNASGTAALIELARMLKHDKKSAANYLVIAFSGEELGLNGSKYFTEHPTRPLEQVTYMINMDMVGRLNDSSHTLTVGGYGTSPSWSASFASLEKPDALQFKFDSSGTGPSDHSSFYRKDIPVLFFFTGLHSDYHKPSDDANRINYVGEYRILQLIHDLVRKTPTNQKLVFTKTREQSMSTARFSVTLGIMPDYTFSGNGVKVDGVSEGRPAKKAGIQAGDIILQLGNHSTASIEDYMKALGTFKKGDTTTVKFQRSGAEMNASVEF